MNVLVTAGNTRVYIDKVRCLTNIFTGRTGAAIALVAFQRGHSVTLLTSHPETAAELLGDRKLAPERWQIWRYDTLADLRQLMEQQLRTGDYHALVHCAAVSDYLGAGVYAPAPGTTFGEQNAWQT